MSNKTMLKFELTPQMRDELENLKKAGGFPDDQALCDAAIEFWKTAFRFAQADIGIAALNLKEGQLFRLEMPELETAKQHARKRKLLGGTSYIQ